jgi:EF-P beta-lysylation protein EpmB
MTQLNKPKRWQDALIHAVTDPKELLEILELDEQFLEPAIAAAKLFSLKVPRGFLSRIKKGDINDPLLKQILPLDAELQEISGYETDPLKEAESNPLPGLLHKYHSRVLLTLTGTCAINCRYCFRRHFPYEKNNPGTSGWEKTLDYIANDASISEVILSGGDPLILNDGVLSKFSQKLSTISHVKRLRIHSRIPIVLPERITPELIEWMTNAAFKTILVVHANHPQEIDHTVQAAIQILSEAGIVLLNQSVLLKGINDQVETLVQLSERLFEIGILPYYLHVLDKVQGTAHFDLAQETAVKLHWELTQRLSGFLIPKLVCEQPGAPAKLSILNREFYTA